MRQSHLFTHTSRENPHDEESKNAILLQRGGYIHKTLAGAYTFLPLGLRVLRKVADIIRKELNQLPHTSEVQMTILQSKETWSETGRWDSEGMREVMYRVAGEGDEQPSTGLGATHEENVTDIFRSLFHSYRELPLAVYQIQTKFRKEARPKSGLLRGREFLMKDLYSFHTSKESLDEYYEAVAAAYLRIFAGVGLQAIRTEASGGVFSKEHSDEFQVICPVGEDDIYLNTAGDRALNKEVVESDHDPRLLEFSGPEPRKVSSIEVGNIFRLGTKYSEPMNARVTLADGSEQAVYMGCYGIGVSRLVGTLVELYGEAGEGGKGARIVWPAHVAPVACHILDLAHDGMAETLYTQLLAAGVEVLWDDRQDVTPGEKFADADLIGAPHRAVVSKRSQEAGGVEYRMWPSEEIQILSVEEAVKGATGQSS